jgi:protein-S-isoprenylcysteine O-methyltransferase Ste14
MGRTIRSTWLRNHGARDIGDVTPDTSAAVLEGAAFPLRARGKDSWFIVGGRIFLSVALAALWLFFAWSSVGAWRENGRPSGLGAVALELLLVVLFIVRRAPKESSQLPLDWLVTIGAFAVLAARPISGDPTLVSWVGEGVQFIGLAGAVWSLLALGRSFGIVPANRGLRTGGPYGLVRHPLYAFYVVSWAGYVLENPAVRNILVFSVASVFQLLRMHREELFLMRDTAYRAYCGAVRYRVLPRVY